MDGIWTITELAEHAAAALAADGSAQVSGRVRDLPNERLIRWYTTIGLIDPPLGRRGRTALYGPRHLLQLVAVKRRQAIGRSIAEIQVELAAATDATLERIAALPSRPTPTSVHAPHAVAASPDGRPADPPGTAITGAADLAPTGEQGPTAEPDLAAPARRSAGFTTASAGSPSAEAATPSNSTDEPTNHTAASESPADREGTTGQHEKTSGRTFWNTRPDVSYRPATVADDYGAPLPPVVQGIRLASGVTLVLDVSVLNGDDLAAIENAARPLLEMLHRRGLLVPAETPASPSADPSRRSQ
ncbi:MerR family transcriptional regulator [Actinomadura sp. KC216]|uniref:helix-turn-helix domain-containing protein n=1 Tax=Actinomadura sp. KC216 TaxID=2530370 RepID=UPI001FB64615|nr:MerR family transcriptional regulator [Actinomadura sp. KC216]